MMNKGKPLFEIEVNLLKGTWKDSKKTFWRYWLVIFITIIVAYLTTYLAMYFLNLEPKKIVSDIGKVGIDSVSNDKESYWEGTVGIFKNNWITCLQILILSFIPVPFLYSILLLGTSAVLGVAIGLAQKVGMNLFSTIFLGVLPHSILELSVFILATIYGGKINLTIRWKIMNLIRRNKKVLPSVREYLKETFIVFIFVITPFIFISAFIEGYITRYLFN